LIDKATFVDGGPERRALTASFNSVAAGRGQVEVVEMRELVSDQDDTTSGEH
jgi:hypothetical protein